MTSYRVQRVSPHRGPVLVVQAESSAEAAAESQIEDTGGYWVDGAEREYYAVVDVEGVQYIVRTLVSGIYRSGIGSRMHCTDRAEVARRLGVDEAALPEG